MRTCLQAPYPPFATHAYFFHGTEFVRAEVTPGSRNGKIIWGPSKIAEDWLALAKASFHTLDAALPVPGHEGQAYFFSGINYVRIKFRPGTGDQEIIFGPARITDEFPSLAQAGFSTIDTALPAPGLDGEAYFFSGARYCRVKIAPGTRNDKITFGPALIAEEWKSLAHVGFSTIDAALPVTGHKNEAYFFSGSQYCRVKWVPGTPEEKVVFGPASIVEEWPSLRWGW